MLREALRAHRGGALAIPLSGYPDPDAMASGWALAEIAAREGVPALLAIAAACGAMMLRRNDFVAVLVGMAVAALARAWLI